MEVESKTDEITTRDKRKYRTTRRGEMDNMHYQLLTIKTPFNQEIDRLNCLTGDLEGTCDLHIISKFALPMSLPHSLGTPVNLYMTTNKPTD